MMMEKEPALRCRRSAANVGWGGTLGPEMKERSDERRV